MNNINRKTTPKNDGYYMPAEFSKQSAVFMLWPYRRDNWRMKAYPAQVAYADVAVAVSEFAKVTMLVNPKIYDECRNFLPDNIDVIAIPSNDAWCRDIGPTFLKNDAGDIRAVDWKFNAWGGEYDGLYADWSDDDALASKLCKHLGIESYRTDDFVLEGGSIHVDGEGTVMTTEMCLLSPGRNPHMDKSEIENMLCEYLGCEKVLWIKDGIDPDETNGHVDDVACFVRPGEVACIYTDDKENPFYKQSQEAYEYLTNATDAKGRSLKVHKVCLPKNPVVMQGAETIEAVEGTIPRQNGELCIASYLNFLIINDGIIAPQYDDENDALAIEQLRAIFPDKKVIGVSTREVVYGGGNIHCITQQMP